MTIRRWELGQFSPSSNRIAQVAEAYGVEVAELIGASNVTERDDSSVFLPVKGYLDAGGESEPDTSDLGTIAIPWQMARGHTDDFCLLVNGDRLMPDGIHDCDVLLVCPDKPPSVGTLCVVDIDRSLVAFTYVAEGSFQARTASGRSVSMGIKPEQLVGTVVWHVRRM